MCTLATAGSRGPRLTREQWFEENRLNRFRGWKPKRWPSSDFTPPLLPHLPLPLSSFLTWPQTESLLIHRQVGIVAQEDNRVSAYNLLKSHFNPQHLKTLKLLVLFMGCWKRRLIGGRGNRKKKAVEGGEGIGRKKRSKVEVTEGNWGRDVPQSPSRPFFYPISPLPPPWYAYPNPPCPPSSPFMRLLLRLLLERRSCQEYYQPGISKTFVVLCVALCKTVHLKNWFYSKSFFQRKDIFIFS